MHPFFRYLVAKLFNLYFSLFVIKKVLLNLLKKIHLIILIMQTSILEVKNKIPNCDIAFKLYKFWKVMFLFLIRYFTGELVVHIWGLQFWFCWHSSKWGLWQRRSFTISNKAKTSSYVKSISFLSLGSVASKHIWFVHINQWYWQ